jgi:hypothetical protein
MNKNELRVLHNLQAEVKKDIEESAGINDVENYLDTSFGDELINQMERDERGYDEKSPFVKEEVAGRKYSDDKIKITPKSIHKSKDKHRCALLALSKVVDKAVKNEEILEMIDEETEKMAKGAVSSAGKSFTNYSN